MMCPECGNEKTKVNATVGAMGEYSVNRYRSCACGYRFTTVEMVEEPKETKKLSATISEIVQRELNKALVAIQSGKTPLIVQQTLNSRPQPTTACNQI